MSITAIIRKRLGFLVLVVFGVSVITFVISHMIPGDPARLMAGERADAATVAHMRHQLGLDLPLYEQYFRYAKGLLHGDLGTSIRTHRPVLDDIKIFFPATLELGVVALLFATALGAPLGILSAVYKNRLIDHISRTLAVTGISTPAFWLGLAAIALFYGKLGWLPGSGRIATNLAPPEHISGFYLVDALLTGNWAIFESALRHIALPALTLGFVHLGIVARQIRSSMLDAMSEDYVRTARAGGLARWTVILDHALPNALIPSLTVLGLAFGDLLYGAVLTETVFAWPGMGSYVVRSIQALDFPAVMGFTVIVSIAYVLVNLAVDLLYLLLDPRIRWRGAP